MDSWAAVWETVAGGGEKKEEEKRPFVPRVKMSGGGHERKTSTKLPLPSEHHFGSATTGVMERVGGYKQQSR